MTRRLSDRPARPGRAADKPRGLQHGEEPARPGLDHLQADAEQQMLPGMPRGLLAYQINYSGDSVSRVVGGLRQETSARRSRSS